MFISSDPFQQQQHDSMYATGGYSESKDIPTTHELPQTEKAIDPIVAEMNRRNAMKSNSDSIKSENRTYKQKKMERNEILDRPRMSDSSSAIGKHQPDGDSSLGKRDYSSGMIFYLTYIGCLLIDCCLTSSGKYFMHMQDKDKLSNNRS